jgi:hypothetical protein
MMTKLTATPEKVRTSSKTWDGHKVRAILEAHNPPVEGILSINIGAFLVGDTFLNDGEIIKFERLD